MSETKPTASVSRRDEGLALADALLESNRRLLPLPAAAHERVKRRLRARLHSPAARRVRWLRPVVVAASMLLWGTAFGIAIDHFVLEHRVPAISSVQPAAAPDNQHPRRPKAKARPTEEAVVEPEPGASSAQAVPPDVFAPTIAPALPAGPASALPPRPAPLRARQVPVPGDRPAPTPIAFLAPGSVVSPAAREPLANSPGSTIGAAWPAPLPVAPAQAFAPPVTAPPPALPEKPVVDQGNLTEERLLATAVRALRAQHDAASALLALDAYRSRYPQGRMSVEAAVLRVDALTALHRQTEALRSLDELDLTRMPGGLERRLRRGELRLASGRFREALADFDGVLAQAREQELIERALAGGTQTRQRLGDLAGARSDAGEYLRRFPTGSFARQARDIAEPGGP
jgi:hypothetical protein